MADLRLFIAVDLGDALRGAAEGLIEDLRTGVQFTSATPRWVGPKGLHVTLQFLGAVDEGRVDKIVRRIEPAVGQVSCFKFSLRGLGTFPNARQPKVLWVGVKKDKGAMAQLHENIGRALRPLGFKPERRAFHPHLTLARIRSSRGAAQMMDVVESHRRVELGATTARDVTLYRSELNPEGARYTALHRWPLGPVDAEVSAEPQPREPEK